MHIHALKGAWMDHPFWKSKFVINDPADLAKLQASVIKQVVIDVEKGLDVEKEGGRVTESQDKPAPLSEKTTPPIETVVKKISASEETAAAKRIISASKKAVTGMFNDARLGKVVNAEAAMPLVEEISASIDRNKGALVSLARLKTQDDYTYMHSVAVCALMTALAKEMGLSERESKQAGLAGLMHDVGKATIPLEVLNKPGALTDDEFALVKQHPKNGYELLKQAGINDAVTLDVCLHHHEKVDGKGYPDQLSGEGISLYAKMGAICDVYDAVTSDRPYKSGWAPAESIKKMAQWKGHFDEKVFKAFVKSIGIYPIGSVVLLKSKKLGIVIDQSQKSLLTPVVKVFFSTKINARIPIQVIDLSKPSVNDEIASLDAAENWGVENVDELWSEPSS